MHIRRGERAKKHKVIRLWRKKSDEKRICDSFNLNSTTNKKKQNKNMRIEMKMQMKQAHRNKEHERDRKEKNLFYNNNLI